MQNPSTATIYQSKLFRIRADVAARDTEDVITKNIPLVFPEGPDWKYIKTQCEKFRVDNVQIEVKPYYNFATAASAIVPGKVTGDFPIYMSFYNGNTVGERDDADMASLILTGRYHKGSATSGVKADFSSEVFKTIFQNNGNEKTVVNKDTESGLFDGSLLSNENVALQLGRIGLSVRKDDFHVEDGTATSMLARHLKSKAGIAEDAKEEKETKPAKKSRKQPAPEPEPEPTPDEGKYDYNYPDLLDKDNHLYVDYLCYITAKINISYNRKSDQAENGSYKIPN